MRYYAGFDVSLLSAGTLTVNPTNGTSVVITLANLTGNDRNSESSSLFFHVDPVTTNLYMPDYSLGSNFSTDSSRLVKWVATPYADALQSAIRTAATTAGDWTAGPSNFDVTFDNTEAEYTFAYAENFTLTWSMAVGRYFLGFSSNQSGAATYTSNVPPFFVVVPVTEYTHQPSVIYEPEGVASVAIADNGSGFGIARSEAPLMARWTQAFESKEKTLAIAALLASGLFTHQHLRGHCRTVYPFAVHDGFGEGSFPTMFCRFTADSSHMNWEDIRATPGNDSQLHVPYEVYVEGWGT